MNSQVNFKLGAVINNTIDCKIKNKKDDYNSQNLAAFYNKHKEDINKVGRSTTYDVVGGRNYKNHFDEKKYKF
ncbi:hypothetical protein [Apocheima cinerarium nucleopolyhedrovirus]|uniref:hypothetical protein n=1 Tax=Apocheima cinerarium nucleopolyhedrovirus TaxID=307461 RepID=UPI0001D92052|nr:hypothetical protein [Apocheima cinerarium nucleopolyhedrovirus]ADB84390.1 hypothetical protein [Apocheima cinerarium nucleopolyhedrovirus]